MTSLSRAALPRLPKRRESVAAPLLSPGAGGAGFPLSAVGCRGRADEEAGRITGGRRAESGSALGCGGIGEPREFPN